MQTRFRAGHGVKHIVRESQNCRYNLRGKFVHHDFQMAVENRDSVATPLHILRCGFAHLGLKSAKHVCKRQEELVVREARN